MVTSGPPRVLRTMLTVCPAGPNANPLAPAPDPEVPFQVLPPCSGQARNDLATAVKTGSFGACVVS